MNNAGQWIEIVELSGIPVLGSRVVKIHNQKIAVFRGSQNQIFAIRDACPHKNGPLSQGIMHGHWVTCPLHHWKIDLSTGQAMAPDEGCSHLFPVKLEAGKVFLQWTPPDNLPGDS